MGRQAGDDPPAPTLSQLKAQMESAAGGETASSGSINNNNSVGVLPTHMFGNALNPASSMAQRMVDTLSQEMEAVAAAGAVGIPDIVPPPAPVVGITLPGKSCTLNKYFLDMFYLFIDLILHLLLCIIVYFNCF